MRGEGSVHRWLEEQVLLRCGDSSQVTQRKIEKLASVCVSPLRVVCVCVCVCARNNLHSFHLHTLIFGWDLFPTTAIHEDKHTDYTTKQRAIHTHTLMSYPLHLDCSSLGHPLRPKTRSHYVNSDTYSTGRLPTFITMYFVSA